MPRSRSGGRRRSTRGARANRRPARISGRSMPRPSRACATKSDPIRETPMNCTTRSSRQASCPAEEAGGLPPDLFAELCTFQTGGARHAAGRGHLGCRRTAARAHRRPSGATPDATALNVPASRSARIVDARRRDRRARAQPPLAGRPDDAACLAASMSIAGADADAALLALESEGVVLRGRFSGADDLEWCDRRLLARIHRYTLNRLRAEIEPITAGGFPALSLRVARRRSQPHQLAGIDGLRSVLSVLDGLELPASAWERAVLPARLDHYDPAWLDMLCLTGEAGMVAPERALGGERRETGAAGRAVPARARDGLARASARRDRGRTLAGRKQPADSGDAAHPRAPRF